MYVNRIFRFNVNNITNYTLTFILLGINQKSSHQQILHLILSC